jgi:hypothetical protein
MGGEKGGFKLGKWYTEPNYEIKAPIEDDTQINNKKARKDKKPTVCKSKIRNSGSYYFRQEHCGICGSENITKTKLVYCTACEKEKYTKYEPWEWAEEKEYFTKKKVITKPCECNLNKDFWNRYDGYKVYENYHCLDCSATFGPLCSNCGKHCWSRMSKGERLVTCSCGYFRN